MLNKYFVMTMGLCIPAFVSVSLADTYTVPSGKYQTIQSAIDACNVNGDEIVALPYVYFEKIDFQGKSIYLRSSMGNSVTIIDGQGQSGALVTFANEEDDQAVIEGFTIRNSPSGSGIACANSSPTIRDCKIIGNYTPDSGGGMTAADSHPTVISCEFKNNEAFAKGGAINSSGGDLTISNTLIRANRAQDGGGIYAIGTAIGMDSCDIEDNNAMRNGSNNTEVAGGGMWMNNCDASIVGTNFSGNTANLTTDNAGHDAYAKGGALYLDISNTNFTNCNFLNNSVLADSYPDYGNPSISHASGGAVYMKGAAPSFFVSCIFDGSSAYASGHNTQNNNSLQTECQANGGAFFLLQTSVFLTYCNIQYSDVDWNAEWTAGTCEARGGGIYHSTNGNSMIQNSSIAYNESANQGGGIFACCQSAPLILFCEFTSNTASNGAGLASYSATPTMSSCVFNLNTATNGSGGGIYSEGSDGDIPTVLNSLFCQNLPGHTQGSYYDDGGNIFSEFCGDDCNGNDLPDEWDLLLGLSQDCNDNGVPDECDIADGTEDDCDGNEIPDNCDIADGTHTDCDGNGVPDVCDTDCNQNGVPDGCDIADGTSTDCNVNGIPDECEGDCNGNGIPDPCETDCNGNGVPDDCDIIDGTSDDCDGNGVPDECDPDCNNNGVSDACDIFDGISEDCDGSGIPDECEPIPDCNGNDIHDGCDISNGDSQDDNGNGVPDECECPADVNEDGFVNVNDLLAIVGAWGPCTSCSEDINGDGYVNVTDLLTVIDRWGTCP